MITPIDCLLHEHAERQAAVTAAQADLEACTERMNGIMDEAARTGRMDDVGGELIRLRVQSEIGNKHLEGLRAQEQEAAAALRAGLAQEMSALYQSVKAARDRLRNALVEFVRGDLRVPEVQYLTGQLEVYCAPLRDMSGFALYNPLPDQVPQAVAALDSARARATALVSWADSIVSKLAGAAAEA